MVWTMKPCLTITLAYKVMIQIINILLILPTNFHKLSFAYVIKSVVLKLKPGMLNQLRNELNISNSKKEMESEFNHNYRNRIGITGSGT